MRHGFIHKTPSASQVWVNTQMTELVCWALSNHLHCVALPFCPTIAVFFINQRVLNKGRLLLVLEVLNVSTSQSYTQLINKLWLFQFDSIDLYPVLNKAKYWGFTCSQLLFLFSLTSGTPSCDSFQCSYISGFLCSPLGLFQQSR